MYPDILILSLEEAVWGQEPAMLQDVARIVAQCSTDAVQSSSDSGPALRGCEYEKGPLAGVQFRWW